MLYHLLLVVTVKRLLKSPEMFTSTHFSVLYRNVQNVLLILLCIALECYV